MGQTRQTLKDDNRSATGIRFPPQHVWLWNITTPVAELQNDSHCGVYAYFKELVASELE